MENGTIVNGRYEKAIKPKLITTGIRYFEVFGDFKGEYLSAKSTEIITSKGRINIQTILPILNSNVVFFFIREAYGNVSMGGGITFSPDNLSKIPIPNLSENDIKRLNELTIKYNNEFTQEEQNELDQYIYTLYDLNNDDIKVIEQFKIDSRRKK